MTGNIRIYCDCALYDAARPDEKTYANALFKALAECDGCQTQRLAYIRGGVIIEAPASFRQCWSIDMNISREDFLIVAREAVRLLSLVCPHIDGYRERWRLRDRQLEIAGLQVKPWHPVFIENPS